MAKFQKSAGVFSAADINEKSLGLFSVLTPQLDLLIIGTGNKKQELHPDTVKFLRKNQIIFEVLSTDQAIATFNFQNNDQRWIAAALIPPEEAKKDLLSYVQNVYGNILDSTEMIYTEEKDLTQIGSTQSEGKQRLQDSSVRGEGKEQLEMSEKDDVEMSDEKTDTQVVKPPLGQSLDFLSSDSIERLHDENEEKPSETTNKKNNSEEKKK